METLKSKNSNWSESNKYCTSRASFFGRISSHENNFYANSSNMHTMCSTPSRRAARTKQTDPWSCGFICLLAMTLSATAHPIAGDTAHLSDCGPGCLSPGSRMDPPGRRSDDTELYVTAASSVLILEQSTYHLLNCPDPNANSELVLGAQESFNEVSQPAYVCIESP